MKSYHSFDNKYNNNAVVSSLWSLGTWLLWDDGTMISLRTYFNYPIVNFVWQFQQKWCDSEPIVKLRHLVAVRQSWWSWDNFKMELKEDQWSMCDVNGVSDDVLDALCLYRYNVRWCSVFAWNKGDDVLCLYQKWSNANKVIFPGLKIEKRRTL